MTCPNRDSVGLVNVSQMWLPSDDIAVLIDRAPEILSLALNRGKDFVDMHRIP